MKAIWFDSVRPRKVLNKMSDFTFAVLPFHHTAKKFVSLRQPAYYRGCTRARDRLVLFARHTVPSPVHCNEHAVLWWRQSAGTRSMGLRKAISEVAAGYRLISFVRGYFA